MRTARKCVFVARIPSSVHSTITSSRIALCGVQALAEGGHWSRHISTAPSQDEKQHKKKKLVVLGNGWAGYRVIRDIDLNKYDLNIISPRNYFLFTPLLTATTVGTLEFRGVTEPVRVARPDLHYVQANCTEIDTVNKTVTFESVYEEKEKDEDPGFKPTATMKYDELVVAVGAAPNTFGVCGVEKYCFFLKTVADARNIRQRIIECFERASNPVTTEEEKKRLLHFVIVGGGPTSVEFSAELHDFLRKDVHKIFPELEHLVTITLVEASKVLLGSFDKRLSEYTMRLFAKRRIDVRTGVAVKEVKRHEIILTSGESIPFGLGVWSTGLAPVKLVSSLPWKRDKGGRIVVDEYLRVMQDGTVDGIIPNVYAAGDCATFEANPLAATAQAAEQEGKYLARLLNNKAKGKDSEPFHYQHKGMLAYIGGYRALLDSPAGKQSGFFTWILWNAAYITKLLSIKNKIMIPMYWFKSFVFGRDVSRF